MAQQVIPRLRRRCLIGSLTAPSWKSAKNGTTIRLAGKGSRLSCSVDCKKPTHPTGWCAGRARRRPARTREEQAPVPRERPERCRAVQTVAESETPTGARRAQRGINGVLPATAASGQTDLARLPYLVSLLLCWRWSVSRIARARVLDAAEFRSYSHYTREVNGVATPVPYLCRSAACHGVSIVSSKLFPSMLT
jgi:hypothetical protein